MKFVIDNALSPVVAEALRQAGHDVCHVRDLGLASAPDEAIFDIAFQQERTIVSADTDFGTIVASRRQRKPSIILFRGATPRRPTDQAALLLANLPAVETIVELGAVVVIEPNRIRVRTLPIIS